MVRTKPQRYVTTDGREFDTKDAAENHEKGATREKLPFTKQRTTQEVCKLLATKFRIYLRLNARPS